MFWLVSALTVIVPELSDNTCCPLTYKDPGPTYMSRHCFANEPKSYVMLALGIICPSNEPPPK